MRYQYRTLTLQKVTDATGLGIAAVYQELPLSPRFLAHHTSFD